jgi:hypothetical protein
VAKPTFYQNFQQWNTKYARSNRRRLCQKVRHLAFSVLSRFSTWNRNFGGWTWIYKQNHI